MKFSKILKELENGKFVRRQIWSSESYVWLKQEFEITPKMCSDELLKQTVIKNGGVLTGNKSLSIIVKDGNKLITCPWSPTNIDLFSDDWETV